MRAARFLVPMTALALLAGCAGAGSDDGSNSDVAGGGRGNGGEAGPTRSDGSRLVVTEQTDGHRDEETSARADDGADGTAATAALAACLQGTWEFTPESVEEAMVASVDVWSEITATVTGSMTMTFDALTVTTRYKEFRMTATSQDGTEVIETTSVSDGTTVATYSLDRDIVSMDASEASGLRSDTTTTVNGVELTNPELEARQQAAENSPVGPPRTQQATCSGDRLTLAPLSGDGVPMPDLAMTATRR